MKFPTFFLIFYGMALEFIEEFSDDATWPDWKQIARNIVTSLESMGLISQFRIGQSMSNIIFSTLDHHQVFGHRHVTISMRPDEKTVHVAYSTKSILFKSFIAEDTYPVAEVIPDILSYLRRLWIDTKPELPIPDVLKLKRRPFLDDFAILSDEFYAFSPT
jgi:hypothetical protein